MATVQHLEKLYQVQALFETSETLESTVAVERISNIIAQTEKLLYQRTFLRDERRRLRVATEQIEEKEKALKLMKREDWIPEAIKTTEAEPHIMINVGGLMFESPKSVLMRDKDSLLAQLCSPEPPLLMDPDGFFFFDRDWWLFRYIMNFLRDGVLPDDRTLLSQLYREASFWNLKELQRAIEENKLHLLPDKPDKIDKNLWWRKLPNWWQAIDEANEKKKKEEEDKKKKVDWWKDTTYNGKVFLPLSNAPDKIVTKPGEKDELKVSTSTWSTKPLANALEEDYGLYSSPYRPLSSSQTFRPSSSLNNNNYIGSNYNNNDNILSSNIHANILKDRQARLAEIRDAFPLVPNTPVVVPDPKDRMNEIRSTYN